MIRIFYMKSRFLHCVSYFFDCQKRAILTKTIRSFPSSPSPTHQILCVTETYTDFMGGAPNVDFCIIFTHLGHYRATVMWDSKCTPPTQILELECGSTDT